MGSSLMAGSRPMILLCLEQADGDDHCRVRPRRTCESPPLLRRVPSAHCALPDSTRPQFGTRPGGQTGARAFRRLITTTGGVALRTGAETAAPMAGRICAFADCTARRSSFALRLLT